MANTCQSMATSRREFLCRKAEKYGRIVPPEMMALQESCFPRSKYARITDTSIYQKHTSTRSNAGGNLRCGFLVDVVLLGNLTSELLIHKIYQAAGRHRIERRVSGSTFSGGGSNSSSFAEFTVTLQQNISWTGRALGDRMLVW